MWQAINYDHSMFNTTSVSRGQFATPSGQNVTRASALKPFRNTPLAFHTSELVTNTSALGYTYPDTYDSITAPEHLRAFVVTQVNILYGPNSSYDRPKSFPNPQKLSSNRQSMLATKDKYFIAKVQLDRSELPLPATISLVVNGTGVGTVALLAMPSDGILLTDVPILDPRLAGLTAPDADSISAISLLQHRIAVDIRHVSVQCFTRFDHPSMYNVHQGNHEDLNTDAEILWI